MATLGEANIGGRMVPAWLLDLTAEKLESLRYCSNPNLLDNPWFTINQRGATSYTGNAVGYTTVDRIKMTYGNGQYSVSIGDSGLTVGPGVGGANVYPHQILEPAIVDFIDGKTVTCSCKLSDGNILAHSFVRSNGSNQWKTVGNVRIGIDNSNKFRFDVIGSYGTSVTFRAIKLELGPVSTLANDAPPNDAMELAKCQRYFQRIAFTTDYPLVYGVSLSTGEYVRGKITFTGKRINPSVSISISNFNSFRVRGNGMTSNVPTSISFSGRQKTEAVVDFSTNNLSSGNIYALVPVTGGYIDVSADL